MYPFDMSAQCEVSPKLQALTQPYHCYRQQMLLITAARILAEVCLHILQSNFLHLLSNADSPLLDCTIAKCTVTLMIFFCVQVMLLLASAPKSPLRRNDLGSSSRLQFQVHARETGKEQLQMLDVDLSVFVGQAAAKAAGALSNGHQTMVIAGVYTVSIFLRV